MRSISKRYYLVPGVLAAAVGSILASGLIPVVGNIRVAFTILFILLSIALIILGSISTYRGKGSH